MRAPALPPLTATRSGSHHPRVACRADAGRDVLDVAAAPLAGEGLCVRAAEPGRTGRVRCEHGPATAGEVGHDGPPDSRRLTGRATVDVDEQRRPRGARRAGGPPEQPWDGGPVLRRPGDGLGLGEADRLEPAGRAAAITRRPADPCTVTALGVRAPERTATIPAGPQSRPWCQPRAACLDAAAGAGDDQPAEAVLVAHRARRPTRRATSANDRWPGPQGGSACSCGSGRTGRASPPSGSTVHTFAQPSRSVTKPSRRPSGDQRGWPTASSSPPATTAPVVPVTLGDDDPRPIPRHVREIPFVPRRRAARRASTPGPTRSRRR